MDFIEKLKGLQNQLAVGNLKKVIEGCNKILKKYPNNALVLNLLGLALQKNKQVKQSTRFFIGALDNDPNNIAAINNLANSYKALGNIELAEELYIKAINLNPKYISALNNYGNLKLQLNDFNEASNLFKKALALNKNEITLLFGFASALQGLGNFSEAITVLKKVLSIDPKNSSAHKMLSSIMDYKNESKESNSHLAEMEKLIIDNDLNNDQKIDLSFALAKAQEEIGSFDSSFKNLERGNFLKKTKFNYSIGGEEKLFNNIIKTFNDFDFDRFSKINNFREIIFICGMPRSGTTLVEQIIASHKEVYGAGELIYLQDALNNNFIADFKLNKQKIIDQAALSENNIANEYFNRLKNHKFDQKKITDKAPQNFRWIGFIKIFFPNSKIIHCKRNPKDNCLSLFKNSFASSSMSWSYDQTDIAKYYNLYDDLMKFWKKKLPNYIYDVNYEALVSNQEEEIKKIISHCKLEWDPSCLNHHKNNKTPIQTASVSQARKPIYKTSINLNDNFKKHLQTMYNILDTH